MCGVITSLTYFYDSRAKNVRLVKNTDEVPELIRRVNLLLNFNLHRWYTQFLAYSASSKFI